MNLVTPKVAARQSSLNKNYINYCQDSFAFSRQQIASVNAA
jgi:hypothetical protein